VHPLGEQLGVEDHPPGEHLEQHAAEGVDVRARVHGLGAALLRRHIGRRADDRPDARQSGHDLLRAAIGLYRLLGLNRAHQPEVGHFSDAVVPDEDIGRFEIAVYQAGHAPGGVLHPQRNLQGEVQRLAQVKAVVANPTAQVGAKPFWASDMLQDDMRAALELLHAPRLNDVAVLFEHDPGARLLGEAGDGGLVGQQAALESLDGDRLPLFVVVAQVDDAHAAAQHLGHLVAPVYAVAEVEVGPFPVAGGRDERIQ